jgi:hypothetical protein
MYSETDEICLICWLPSNVKQIKEFEEKLHITFVCNCNPLFHYKCIEKWFVKSNSCPICRTKVVGHTNNFYNRFFVSSVVNLFMVGIVYTYIQNIWLVFIYAVVFNACFVCLSYIN